MEQSQVITETDVRSRLLETARAMVLRGEQKFSIAGLCAEAGLDRAAFRAHFSGKTQLMAALMAQAQILASPAPEPAPAPAPVAAVAAPAEAPKTQDQTPKAASEPSVPTPDAWLERRLRVFERALTALEAKAEASSREQARVIAELEERLAKMGPAEERHLEQRPVTPAAPVAVKPAPVAVVAPVEEILEAPGQNPATAEAAAEDVAEAAPVETVEKNANLLEIAPAPAVSLSKEEMAEVLQAARGKARAAAAAPEPAAKTASPSRARWLAIGGLALLVLFLCIGLSLGKAALATRASAATESDAVAHSKAPQGLLARTIAEADAGDAKAQVRLAMMYLKGDGVAADAAAALRWSRAAAEAGQPVGEYLLGSLYREGSAVPADAVKAFGLFEAAANKGNLKAMHNLAIAYAEGLGTDKNEAKAAEWFKRAAERGYVDSAFDLAVLYERGLGVTQDLKEALTWYGIAARMGDVPAEERVTVLRGQISSQAASLAADAARNFSPVPPLSDANRL